MDSAEPILKKTRDQLGRELVYAAYNNNTKKCEELLSIGAPIDFYDSNMYLTPLMAAAKAGANATIMFLTANEANKELVDISGNRACDMYDAVHNDPAILSVLMVPGGLRKPMPPTPSPNDRLIAAIESNDLQGCTDALASGADINFRDPRYNNLTPLMAAASMRDSMCLKYLLIKGADRSQRNSLEQTALHMYAHSQGKDDDILDLFLKDAEDVYTANDIGHVKIIYVNDSGWSGIPKQLHACADYMNMLEEQKKTPYHITIPSKPVAGLWLRKVFNFESYERITISLDADRVQNGFCVQPFSDVQNDPDLKTAYNLCVKCGGKPDEEKVFTTQHIVRKGVPLTLVSPEI